MNTRKLVLIKDFTIILSLLSLAFTIVNHLGVLSLLVNLGFIFEVFYGSHVNKTYENKDVNLGRYYQRLYIKVLGMLDFCMVAAFVWNVMSPYYNMGLYKVIVSVLFLILFADLYRDKKNIYSGVGR